MTLEEYFATGPDRERPIFEVVHDHLESLGPVHVEAVSVGIFFKTSRTFVELRPKVRWEALSFVLARRVQHPRIARTMQASAERIAHVVNVHGPEDVDQQVLDWLTESYILTAP